jgi:hypothetical protein
MHFSLRMTTNNSELGRTPSEPFIKNKENQTNLDQLLSTEIFTINQQSSSSSSSLPINPATMIANVQQQQNDTFTGQYAQHEQRQQYQHEIRQRQAEQRRLRQEQQEQQRERKRRR